MDEFKREYTLSIQQADALLKKLDFCKVAVITRNASSSLRGALRRSNPRFK